MEAHIERAERTLALVERALSGLPHKIVGSFSGNRQKFSPESDLDIAVRAADAEKSVDFLRAELIRMGITKISVRTTKDYRFPPVDPDGPPKYDAWREYTIVTPEYAPVQVIGSLEN